MVAILFPNICIVNQLSILCVVLFAHHFWFFIEISNFPTMRTTIHPMKLKYRLLFLPILLFACGVASGQEAASFPAQLPGPSAALLRAGRAGRRTDSRGHRRGSE